MNQPSSLTSREHDAFLVDTERVDDGLVADKVVHKYALGALPLFDAVVVSCDMIINSLVPSCAGAGKAVLCRVDRQRSHRFLVVGQGGHTLAGGQVPQSYTVSQVPGIGSPDGAIHATRNDLRVRGLGLDIRDGACVSSQGENVRPGSHVPYTHACIATGGHEHVESGVHAERVDAREMSVVMSDDFVHLKVPALHHLQG